MNPIDFLKTIYLGDRGCKSVLIDGWNSRILVQITQISRIRSASGNWEFYTEEDINDGWIVFTEARSIEFSPSGFIPNDSINLIEAEPVISSTGRDQPVQYLFRIHVNSVDADAISTDVIITITAEGIHLEDPSLLGSEITE